MSLSARKSGNVVYRSTKSTVNETGEPRGVVVERSETQTDAQTVGVQQRTEKNETINSL